MTQQPPHEPEALTIDLTDRQASISAAGDSPSEAEIDHDRGPQDRAAERRCVLSRESFPKDQLMRFVVGPEDILAVDLAGKLPGRGVWLRPDRDQISAALAKNKLKGALSRGLKTQLQLPEGDFLDILTTGLRRRALDRLGLENRAGHVTSGSDKIRSQGAAKADLLLVANDASEDGLRKIIASTHKNTRICQLFDREALSQTLGKDNAVHVLISAGRGAEFLSTDIEKLAGILGQSPYLPDRNYRTDDIEEDD